MLNGLDLKQQLRFTGNFRLPLTKNAKKQTFIYQDRGRNNEVQQPRHQHNVLLNQQGHFSELLLRNVDDIVKNNKINPYMLAMR